MLSSSSSASAAAAASGSSGGLLASVGAAAARATAAVRELFSKHTAGSDAGATSPAGDVPLLPRGASASGRGDKSAARARRSAARAHAASAGSTDDDDDESGSVIASAGADKPKRTRSLFQSLRGDWSNVLVLLLLYTLQGVPMGLSMTIPLILQERTAAATAAGAAGPAGGDYAAQAIFSLVSLPFSFKLLWAPLVDALYAPAVGRRKTWVVPVQLLCGAAMLFWAADVDHWLGGHGAAAVGTALDAAAEGAAAVNVGALTIYFLFLYTLMATQDIAVDGWALTLLRRRNTPLAASVNAVGQTLGAHATHVGYMVLASAEACDGWVRPLFAAAARAVTAVLGDALGLAPWLAGVGAGAGGMVTLPTFFRFTGLAYACVTVAVALYQREWDVHPLDAAAARRTAARRAGDAAAARAITVAEGLTDDEGADAFAEEDAHEDDAEMPSTVSETVSALAASFRVPVVRLTVLFLILVSRTGSAPGESVASLKLLEGGVSKTTIAAVSAAAAPVGILVPVLAAGLAASRRAWRVTLWAIPARIVLCFFAAALTVAIPAATAAAGADASVGDVWWVYPALLLLTVVQSTTVSIQMLCGMGLFARVADRSIGGTFMTMLNTAGNLSAAWTRAAALALVKPLTVAHCSVPAVSAFSTAAAAAATAASTTAAAATAADTAVDAGAAAAAGVAGAAASSAGAAASDIAGGWAADAYGAVVASALSVMPAWLRAAAAGGATVGAHISAHAGAARSVGLYAQCGAGLHGADAAHAEAGRAACAAAGGACEVLLDGYLVETALFAALGLVMLWLFWARVSNFDDLPLSDWRPPLPSAAAAALPSPGVGKSLPKWPRDTGVAAGSSDDDDGDDGESTSAELLTAGAGAGTSARRSSRRAANV